MMEEIQKEKKPKLLIAYDITFCLLAIVAVSFSICDIIGKGAVWQQQIDTLISIVFIADYVIRLGISKDKISFFKDNMIDLIAIIPFTSLFKILRFLKILKTLRILKLLKLVRLSAYFARLYGHIKFFFDINGLKYMTIASILCVIAGGIAIHFAEGMELLDGIWWSFVTVTTVGYGDISPSSGIGRMIAAVLMLIGIGLIGSLTSTITALFFHKKTDNKQSTKNDIIQTIQSQLNTFDDLSNDDIETICNTLKALHKNIND